MRAKTTAQPIDPELIYSSRRAEAIYPNEKRQTHKYLMTQTSRLNRASCRALHFPGSIVIPQEH